MSKHVESCDQVTELLDLKVAKEASSLLYDLKWRFSELRELIRVYIPDYSIGQIKTYSLLDICKIYSKCKQIQDIRWKLKDETELTYHETGTKVTLRKWIICSNCATKDEFTLLDSYMERFNTLYHLLGACREMNVETHNAIHTVFKTANSKSLDTICGFLERAWNKVSTFVNEENCCMEVEGSNNNDINVRKNDYITYFYSLSTKEPFNKDKFKEVYKKYITSGQCLDMDFESWLKDKDIDYWKKRPVPEYDELWDSYAKWFWVIDDEEKYQKLFEDWRDNFRPNGLPFDVYLMENGYIVIGNTKPKKVRQKTLK